MSGASQAEKTVYRFDDLELNVGLQRLTRDGVEVPLPKLSFELLLALAEAAPNFVTHRKLLARVWPGLIVTNKTVNQRVKLLRDALDDDPAEPRYILVLRGRGYRLKPPLLDAAETPLEAAPRLPATSTAQRPPDSAASPDVMIPSLPALRPSSRWRRPGTAVGLAGLAALCVGAATWLVGATFTQPTSIETPTASELTRSVAVLPFRDLSANAADAYLALGLAETVLNRLAANGDLRLVASSSSLREWENDASAAQIGRRLNARYLVEGSVQRVGGQLRIATRLLDSTSDTQVWSETFDRDIGNLFAAQDEIADRIAEVLRATAGGRPLAPSLRPTENVDAYLSYLRGRAAITRWTASSADAADAALSRAIELDPGFPAAHAALYDARMMAADRRSSGASANLAGRALAAARASHAPLIERALDLDPNSGAARFARAIWADDAAPTREQDFRLGLDLDPSNGRGITAFAEFLDRTGRRDEGERMLARAVEIDPLSPRAHFWRVQRKFPGNPASFTAGMPAVPVELEAGMLAVLELDPDYLPALQRYAKYRWQTHGDFTTALPMIERALALDPQSAWLTRTAVAMYLDLGAMDEAHALNARAAQPEIAGELLLAVAANDIEGAGDRALTEAAFADGTGEAWGAVDALRDWAIANDAAQRALDHLRSRFDFSPGITIANFRAVPGAASLLIATGETAAARTLLSDLVSWIDSYHLPRLGTIYALRVKAKALLLLGETELALTTLDASFRGNDFLQWWYTLRLDPEWATLRDDPRFIATAARVQRHIDDQATRVETLRLQGALPRRGGATAAQLRP